MGVAVIIEVKVPGKKPEPLQLAKIARWRKSGAVAFWTDRSEGVVDRVVNEIQQRTIENFLPIT